MYSYYIKVFEQKNMIKYMCMFILKLPLKLNQTFIEVVQKDIPQNCYTSPLNSDNYGGLFIFNSDTTVSTATKIISYVPQTGVYSSVESELHHGGKKMERTAEIRESDKV